MNWSVWGPVLATAVTAILGLVGILVTASKSHRGAMAQANAATVQANAALTQADAALAAAQSSAKIAEATARAAIDDTFTRAYEAADAHWARYTEAQQRDNDDLRSQISENSMRIENAEMRSIADRAARTEAEKNFRIAIAYLRRVMRWIDEVLPGEHYPPPPPELLGGLSEEW